MRRRVFLVRHGRTALNAEGRLRGRLDPPLDDLGRVEAFELAEQLTYVRPIRIVTSPLLRAVQTAQPLSERVGVALHVEPRLADRDYGRWAGEPTTAVIGQWGSLDAAPDVEPAAAVLGRARAVLDEQIPFLDDGPVVLVGHDILNRLLLSDLEHDLAGPDVITQRTACWNLLLHMDGGWRVEQVDQRADSTARTE